MKIKVKYTQSELKARYHYNYSGMRQTGIKKLFKKWKHAPLYGLQFDPFGDHK